MKIFDITIYGIHIAPSYYGLMYALGFIIGYLILRKRKILKEQELDSLMLYIFFGVILGGRIGYVLFYDLGYYIHNPFQILATWRGGMSFHGGVIGVISAMLFFAFDNYKKQIMSNKGGIIIDNDNFKEYFLKMADNVVAVIPIGLGLGRIGNYLNKELLGREYSGFLAVEKNGRNYFPTPLLEAVFEGILLYIILYFILKNSKNNGNTAGAFLFFYGVFRFSIEFFRTPDVQLGYIYSWLTMGQILSIPMIIAGLYFLLRGKKYNAGQ